MCKQHTGYIHGVDGKRKLGSQKYGHQTAVDPRILDIWDAHPPTTIPPSARRHPNSVLDPPLDILVFCKIC